MQSDVDLNAGGCVTEIKLYNWLPLKHCGIYAVRYGKIILNKIFLIHENKLPQ